MTIIGNPKIVVWKKKKTIPTRIASDFCSSLNRRQTVWCGQRQVDWQ